MSSLEVIQRKNVGARCIALCPTMDLVAIVNEEGSLTVVRTMSWEKVLIKSASDIAISTSRASAVTFSPSGKLIALGHESGEVSVVLIETSAIKQAHMATAGHSNGSASSVSHITWSSTSSWGHTLKSVGYPTTLFSHAAALVDPAGLDLDEAAGMDMADAGDSAGDLPYFPGAKDTALLVLCEDGLLTVYLWGNFPLFSFQTNQQSFNMQFQSSAAGAGAKGSVLPFLSAQDGRGMSYVGRVGMPLLLIHSTADDQKPPRLVHVEQLLLQAMATATATAAAPAQVSSNDFSSAAPSLAGIIPGKQHMHIAAVILKLKADVASMHSLLLTCHRKWKEACKTVLPKLGLLQTVLDGYQIKMSPIHFMYSVCHSGLWHPAAILSFSQHYNEQGLNRLRSSIDSATNLIMKILQIRIQSVATNIILRCKGLKEIIEVMRACGGPGIIAEASIAALHNNAEHVLFKLDDTIHEARSARDAFLLYIQFIKEFGVRANSEAETGVEAAIVKPKWDPVVGAQYMNLFDPRKLRPPSAGKLQQAEYITGTHLYAFLQDMELPAELVDNLQSRCGVQDKLYLQSSNSKDRSSSSRRTVVRSLFNAMGLNDTNNSYNSASIGDGSPNSMDIARSPNNSPSPDMDIDSLSSSAHHHRHRRGDTPRSSSSSSNPLESAVNPHLQYSLAQQVKELKGEVDDILQHACARTSQHLLDCLGLVSHQAPAPAGGGGSVLLDRWITGITCTNAATVPLTIIRDPDIEEDEEDEEENAATIAVIDASFLSFMRHSQLYVLCAVPRLVTSADKFVTQADDLYLGVISSVEGVAGSSPAVRMSDVSVMQWAVGPNSRPGNSHSMSLLVAGEAGIQETAGGGAAKPFLVKLDMRDLHFYRVTGAELTAAIGEGAGITASEKVPAAVRSVALQNIKLLEVSGSRGVAAVADSAGKLVVVDLELEAWAERYE